MPVNSAAYNGNHHSGQHGEQPPLKEGNLSRIIVILFLFFRYSRHRNAKSMHHARGRRRALTLVKQTVYWVEMCFSMVSVGLWRQRAPRLGCILPSGIVVIRRFAEVPLLPINQQFTLWWKIYPTPLNCLCKCDRLFKHGCYRTYTGCTLYVTEAAGTVFLFSQSECSAL